MTRSDECNMAYCAEPRVPGSRWCRKHRDYYGQDSGTRPDGADREQSPSGQQGATSAAGIGDETPSGAAPASLAASKRKRKPRRATDLGIDDDLYEQLLASQDGGCALCGNPPKTRRLHVDHNHRTGQVRGLLCFRCNRGLPTYVTSDWLRNAYVYVLRDEFPDLDVPDQWPEPLDQWADAR